MRFEDKFHRYLIPGDVITTIVDGFEIAARIEHDYAYHIDSDDCHNVDQSVTGCDEEQQMELLAARQAWFRGDWQYVGVLLSVACEGVILDSHCASVWGLECNYPGSDNEHISEVANELLPEALEAGRAVLEKLCKSSATVGLHAETGGAS